MWQELCGGDGAAAMSGEPSPAPLRGGWGQGGMWRSMPYACTESYTARWWGREAWRLWCSYDTLYCPPFKTSFIILQCGHHLLMSRVPKYLWIFLTISTASTDAVVISLSSNTIIRVIATITLHWNAKFLKDSELTVLFHRKKVGIKGRWCVLISNRCLDACITFLLLMKYILKIEFRNSDKVNSLHWTDILRMSWSLK